MPAHADWTGKGEAGLVIATGNTETETANAKLQFANEIGKWKHQFGGAALYASSDDEGTTAQRWEAFEQSDYNFSPRNFWFGAARYEDDEFSGFEYQAIVSTGHRPQVHRHRRHQVHRHGRRRLQGPSRRAMRSTTPAC